MSALGPTTGVKTRKSSVSANAFSVCPRKQTYLPILELLPPPALGEHRHRGLARRGIARRLIRSPRRRPRAWPAVPSVGAEIDAIDPIRSRVEASMAAVVSDVLLPHEPQLVQRVHRQRGRRKVHLLRRR